MTGDCRLFADSCKIELSFPEDRPVLPLKPKCGVCTDAETQDTDKNLGKLEKSSASQIKENSLDVASNKSIFESPERTHNEKRVDGEADEYPEEKARYRRSTKKAKKLFCRHCEVPFKSRYIGQLHACDRKGTLPENASVDDMCKGCNQGFGHRQADHWRGCNDCGGSFHRKCAINVGAADAPMFHYICYSCLGMQQPTYTATENVSTQSRSLRLRRVTRRNANSKNKRDFTDCNFCSKKIALDNMAEHICSCEKYKQQNCLPEQFPFKADEKFDTVKMSPASNACFYRAISYFVNEHDVKVEKWVDVRNQLIAKFLDQSLEKLNSAIDHWRDADQSVLVRGLKDINCIREVSNESGTIWKSSLDQASLPAFKQLIWNKFAPNKTVQAGSDPERGEMPDYPIMVMAPLVYDGYLFLLYNQCFSKPMLLLPHGEETTLDPTLPVIRLKAHWNKSEGVTTGSHYDVLVPKKKDDVFSVLDKQEITEFQPGITPGGPDEYEADDDIDINTESESSTSSTNCINTSIATLPVSCISSTATHHHHHREHRQHHHHQHQHHHQHRLVISPATPLTTTNTTTNVLHLSITTNTTCKKLISSLLLSFPEQKSNNKYYVISQHPQLLSAEDGTSFRASSRADSAPRVPQPHPSSSANVLHQNQIQGS